MIPARRTAGARRDEGGFTLLEVLIAMGILSLSLTSLLSSQMAAIRATRYAQGVSAAAFLAEHQLIELEWEARKKGWTSSDEESTGTFSDEGWPETRYTCLVDFLELPDYNELARAVDAAEAETGGREGLQTQDAGEQAFGVMGMVWPMIKAAIENSIRKASCTVYWSDGDVEHEFTVATFWTDPQKLQQLPQLGGESTDADDASSDDGAAGAGGAAGGSSAPGGAAGGPSSRGPVPSLGGLGP